MGGGETASGIEGGGLDQNNLFVIFYGKIESGTLAHFCRVFSLFSSTKKVILISRFFVATIFLFIYRIEHFLFFLELYMAILNISKIWFEIILSRS